MRKNKNNLISAILLLSTFISLWFFKTRIDLVDNIYSNIDKIDIISYKLEDNQTEQDFLIIFNPKSNIEYKILDQSKTIVKAEKDSLVLFDKKINKPYFALIKTSKSLTVIQKNKTPFFYLKGYVQALEEPFNKDDLKRALSIYYSFDKLLYFTIGFIIPLFLMLLFVFHITSTKKSFN